MRKWKQKWYEAGYEAAKEELRPLLTSALEEAAHAGAVLAYRECVSLLKSVVTGDDLVNAVRQIEAASR